MTQVTGKDVPALKILYARHGLDLGITRDALEVYIRYVTPDIEVDQEHVDVLSGNFILNLLEDYKIRYGVKRDVIDAFKAVPQEGEYILIAQGTPPTPGTDARIEYVYEKKSEIHAPKILEDGKVDLKDLNLNINVHKGELIAKKIPAMPGKPGQKVTEGEIPPPKSKDCSFPPGRNARISEDGLELHSEIDGTIIRSAQSLNIMDVYLVSGDIDYSTGNIQFVGSMEIGGNVLSGFRVEAQDNIKINGIVEGAEVIAGGDILIARGVQGVEKAEIRAGGSIRVKFVNSAKLYAEKDIIVVGPVLHSTLQAGGKIILDGKKGILNGGRAVAFEGIEADTIGSEAGVATIVEVGVNPHLDERFRNLQEELKESIEHTRKINQVIDTLNRMKSAQGSLPPDREKIMMDSIKTRYSLMGKTKQMQSEVVQIEEHMKKQKSGYIKVRGTLYPGTTIKIRRNVSKIESLMKGVNLHMEGADIVSS